MSDAESDADHGDRSGLTESDASSAISGDDSEAEEVRRKSKSRNVTDAEYARAKGFYRGRRAMKAELTGAKRRIEELEAENARLRKELESSGEESEDEEEEEEEEEVLEESDDDRDGSLQVEADRYQAEKFFDYMDTMPVNRLVKLATECPEFRARDRRRPVEELEFRSTKATLTWVGAATGHRRYQWLQLKKSAKEGLSQLRSDPFESDGVYSSDSRDEHDEPADPCCAVRSRDRRVLRYAERERRWGGNTLDDAARIPEELGK